jgi:nicotinate-nucleotide pyrophosphorylase (carboxylating)
LEAGVDGFLLDNMSPEITKKAVKMIRNFENGDDIFIESSGGINLSNLEHYVSTGVNAISSGA